MKRKCFTRFLYAALFFINLCFPAFIFAATVVLKSGDKIEGNIIGKDERYIKINYKGAAITYYSFEVESIDGKAVAFPEAKTAQPATRAKNDSGEIVKVDAVSAEEYLKRGVTFYTKGNFYLALSNLDKALKIDPHYAQVYAVRGLVFNEQGNPEQAIEEYSKAIENNPNYGEAYYLRGLLYANKGKLDEAIGDYSKAIEMNPNYAETYVNRGLAYVYKGVGEHAEMKLRSPRAYILLKVGSFNQALSDCNKAIAINPAYMEAYFARARVYLFREEYDKSWEDVHKIETLGGKVSPDFLKDLKNASGREK